jgi:hypothetical protein
MVADNDFQPRKFATSADATGARGQTRIVTVASLQSCTKKTLSCLRAWRVTAIVEMYCANQTRLRDPGRSWLGSVQHGGITPGITYQPPIYIIDICYTQVCLHGFGCTQATSQVNLTEDPRLLSWPNPGAAVAARGNLPWHQACGMSQASAHTMAPAQLQHQVTCPKSS